MHNVVSESQEAQNYASSTSFKFDQIYLTHSSPSEVGTGHEIKLRFPSKGSISQGSDENQWPVSPCLRPCSLYPFLTASQRCNGCSRNVEFACDNKLDWCALHPTFSHARPPFLSVTSTTPVALCRALRDTTQIDHPTGFAHLIDRLRRQAPTCADDNACTVPRAPRHVSSSADTRECHSSH